MKKHFGIKLETKMKNEMKILKKVVKLEKTKQKVYMRKMLSLQSSLSWAHGLAWI